MNMSDDDIRTGYLTNIRVCKQSAWREGMRFKFTKYKLKWRQEDDKNTAQIVNKNTCKLN